MDKEINDPEAVLKVITALFGKLPVHIFYDSKEFPCKIVALKNKALVINNILPFKNKDRQLSVIHNGSKFIVQFHCAGSDNNGIEILSPISLVITEVKRELPRFTVGIQNTVSISLTNIVNVNEIQRSLGFDDKKVDGVLESYKAKIQSQFPLSQIFVMERMDNRMRLMNNYDKPIFILDRKNKRSSDPDFFPFEEYVRLFISSKIPEEVISEISIPIRYKGYTPFGYLQILSEAPLDIEIFNQMMLMANSISRDIIATGIFQESREKCQITDISQGGLSFLHPTTRNFSRSMSVNNTVLFDLNLDDGEKITLRGIIKNIKLDVSDYRVGVQFYNLTTKENQILLKFLKESQVPVNEVGDSNSESSEEEDSENSEEEHSENS